MNLPNSVTLSRVCLIPVFLLFLCVPMTTNSFVFLTQNITVTQFVAACIFILASSTDWVDGYLARKYDLVSDFGKFLDPLADKLLITAALIVLVDMHYVSSWVVVVILSREFAVTGLRSIAASKGVVIAADQLGKWKTVSQIVAISFLLLNLLTIGNILMWIATGLTILSGINYFVKNKHVFQ